MHGSLSQQRVYILAKGQQQERHHIRHATAVAAGGAAACAATAIRGPLVGWRAGEV